MSASVQERNRILRLVEAGQITAQEAAQLLDALEGETAPGEKSRNRTLRIRVTSLRASRRSIYVTASLPVEIVRISLHMGAHLLPQLNVDAVEDLLEAIERGANGRLLEIQDLEEGERLEVFAE